MIDTHAHIYDEQYMPDVEGYLAAQHAAGVSHIVVPATDATSSAHVMSLCRRFPEICHPAFGLHPEDVDADYAEQIDLIKQLAQPAIDAGVMAAVGEIGLDYHFSTEYKREQQLALRQQVEWALSLDLPVIIHNRDSTDDCLNILSDYTARGLRGVMHCFSGSRETAERIIQMGLYIGIGGVLTFKNSKLAWQLQGADRYKPVPLERIVLETDSPYMAPVPHRGERNESSYIRYVISKLAETYRLSEEEIEQVTDSNARQLFGF